MKATISLCGQEYPVEIKNGVRYVNGLTVGEFIKTLPLDQLQEAHDYGKLTVARKNEERTL